MLAPIAAPEAEAESTAARLAKAVGRVSRSLRYRTRAARAALGVTDSEAELLRLVRRQPGLRVHDAASELGIASNSVSTLVKQLTRQGLIERSSDPLDGRAACLRLTPEASAWLAQVGSAREAAITRALESLTSAERESLEAAMPALMRLAEVVTLQGGRE
jgi:DNA-binding MarR family transcriptional regulator